MKILAIDTSSNICSTSILENDSVIDEININNEKTHSENLLPIISEILTKNNINLKDIGLISCCVGPGSFTGIRIGVASIKAISEVNSIPIASVTSLEVLAKIDESKRIKVSMIDARNNQVYCGIFDENYEKLEEYLADDIMEIINVIKKYHNIVCIGDGAVLHKDIIEKNIENVCFCEENEQKAKNAGIIGYQKYLKNELHNADNIVPIYLRKSQAERLKNKN